MNQELLPTVTDGLISDAVESVEHAFDAAEDTEAKERLVEELEAPLHEAGYMIVPIEDDSEQPRGRIAGLTRDEIVAAERTPLRLAEVRRQELVTRIRASLPALNDN